MSKCGHFPLYCFLQFEKIGHEMVPCATPNTDSFAALAVTLPQWRSAFTGNGYLRQIASQAARNFQNQRFEGLCSLWTICPLLDRCFQRWTIWESRFPSWAFQLTTFPLIFLRDN